MPNKRIKLRNLSPATIAAEMGISLHKLFRIAADPSRHYLPTRRKRMRKGKVRYIDEPKHYFKLALRLLHDFFQSKIGFHPAACGGVTGKSCFKVAERHCGRRIVESRDIRDCYPSITESRIKSQLLLMGCRSDTSYVLSRIFTLRGSIPQGSPVSNDALNFFLQTFDETIFRTCGRGVTYTRYADDIVISGNDPQVIGRIVDKLEAELQKLGLSVNSEKYLRNGHLESTQRQVVHGIKVNNPNGTSIAPDVRRKATQLGIRFVASCKSTTPNALIGAKKLRQKLAGYINYSTQARYSNARHLRMLLEQGERILDSRLKIDGITRSRKWMTSERRLSAVVRKWRSRLVIRSLMPE